MKADLCFVYAVMLASLAAGAAGGAAPGPASPGDRYKVVQKTNLNAFVDDIKVQRISAEHGPVGPNYFVSFTVAKDAFKEGDAFFQGQPLLDGDLYMVVQKTINPGANRGDVKLSRITAWYNGKPTIKGLSYVVSVTATEQVHKGLKVGDLVRRLSGTIRGLNDEEQAILAGQGGRGQLTIEGVQMIELPDIYLRYIRFLTVPPANQGKPAFAQGKDVAAISALEDPLRRQIFDAMNNATRPSDFPTLPAAQENFSIRLEAIAFMRKIATRAVDFNYYDGSFDSGVADPATWEKVKDPRGAAGFVFNSRPGVDAFTAIQAITSNRFRGECLGALELTLLQAVAKTVDKGRFNAVHPDGLKLIGLPGTDPRQSIYKNTDLLFDGIDAGSMIPGDWCYLQNKADYRDWCPNGPWVGENAIYMGKYEVVNGSPRYLRTAPLRFSGMGLYDLTEAGLRDQAKKDYEQDTKPNSPIHRYGWRPAPNGHAWAPAQDAEIQWKLVGRPRAAP